MKKTEIYVSVFMSLPYMIMKAILINLFLEQLKDEAKQGSRIGVMEVNYLRNVKYVNSNDGFKFW